MHTKRFINLFLIFILFSCTTTIPVKLRKPAQLNIGNARALAVMDFDLQGSWDFYNVEKKNKLADALIKLFSKQKRGLDPLKSYPGKNMSRVLSAKLVQNGHYSLIERSKLQTILDEQSLSLSGLIDPEHANSIGEMVGAQALITGSGLYNVWDEGRWQEYTENKKDKNGKKIKVTKNRFVMQRHVELNFTYRIINVESGLVKTSSTIHKKGTITARGNNELQASRNLASWKSKLDALVNQTAEQIVMQIAPHTVTVQKAIEEGDSDIMETALEYAKRDLWDEAKAIWDEVNANNASSKEDKVAALYNTGLYYEVFNQFSEAANYYNQAFKLSGDTAYLDMQAALKKRQIEVQKLHQQELRD